MTGRRLWFADTLSLALGNGAMLASGAVVSLLSARWLGPSRKGELVVAFAVAALLAPVAAGGVDSFIAARGATLTPPDSSGVLAIARRAAVLGGLLLALATICYGLANGLTPALIGLAACAALLRPALSVLQARWTSLDRLRRVGRILVVMAVIQVVAVVALGFGGATPSDFAASTAVALASGLVLLAISLPKAQGIPASVSPATRRELFRFGGTVVGSDALQLANYRIDLFFLAGFATLAEVGIYVVAVSLAEILWQVPNAVSRSILPRVHAGDIGITGLSRVAWLLAGTLTALGVLGWALTAGIAEPFLGDGFSEVPLLLALLLPGIVALGAVKPYAAWMLSQGKPGRNLRASAIGFAVVVGADLWLIPTHGATGAAVASSLSYVATAIAVILLVPKSVEVTPANPAARPACA